MILEEYFGFKMKRLMLLILCFFSGCNADNTTVSKMIYESNKLGKKFGLYCFGSGIFGPKKIEAYSLNFKSRKSLNIDEARTLLVKYMEEYIKLANTMPDVLKNIENPPFSEKHGYFRISFPPQDYQGKMFSGIEIYKSKVIFLYDYQDNEYRDLFEEPYSEAYFKVYGTYPPVRN